MGTRGLTLVYYKGEYKIAQYGQWDHYPSGQGVTVLKFIQKILRYPSKMQLFKNALNDARYITQEEIDNFFKARGWNGVSDIRPQMAVNAFALQYPMLSRDLGAEILDYVIDGRFDVVLRNSLAFAADSVCCEYAYVIDMDKRKFEIYSGFNKHPLTPTDRFYGVKNDDPWVNSRTPKWYPIKLIKSYTFRHIPKKREFLRSLDKILNKEDDLL